jgi:hypothetical protein
LYFNARAILFSEPIDWTAKSSALVDAVKTAIGALPERERERVFEDFERIDQVSDEIGQRALRSLIEQDEAAPSVSFPRRQRGTRPFRASYRRRGFR